jgi:hypothetical protein
MTSKKPMAGRSSAAAVLDVDDDVVEPVPGEVLDRHSA